jgi:hypothetical protein
MRTLPMILAFLTPVTANAAAVTEAPPQQPRIEVAFVLDTTGSMGGLIEGAKRRIWSIARRIGSGRPRPDLRIALVGYRDKGDEYITRVHDLSGDMDDVYAHLMAFRAVGGGDMPEHVSAALSDAVHRVSWSQGPALRMIFLVGDAPPHVDYQDGFDYQRHAREARQRGIVVETIECGADPETARFWQEIAGLTQGHFARIDSSGGMPVRVTPMDEELARLNTELGETVVAGGSPAMQQASERKLAARAAMPTAMAAEAAGYYAAAPKLEGNDLVDLPADTQKKAVEELVKQPGQAPAALKGKSGAESMAYLKTQQERRAKLQARVAELEKKREAYLATGSKDAFDEQVVQRLAERAGSFGIKY